MNDSKELHSRFIWLNSFFRSHYSSLALEKKCAQLDETFQGLDPFAHLHNVLLYDAVISWCKIFGAKSEECHWKCLIDDQDDFRKFLFSRLSVSKQEFHQYWLDMQEFRNKWVVHYDPSHKHNVVPHFEIAVESAEALHLYLRNNANKLITYTGPESIVDFGESVADAFMSKIK